MELVLKTSGQQCLVGSNPTPSASDPLAHSGQNHWHSSEFGVSRRLLTVRKSGQSVGKMWAKCHGHITEQPSVWARKDPLVLAVCGASCREPEQRRRCGIRLCVGGLMPP